MMLHFEGSANFRMRLVLSLLSEKSIKIMKVRVKSDSVGLQPYESCLLQLLELISNGTVIRINSTGTIVSFTPGALVGGVHEFSTDSQRAVGYYLEPLLILAPFCKTPCSIRLNGITNNSIDPSPEMISYSWLPILSKMIGAAAADGLEIKVEKRGSHPAGGGSVLFRCKPTLVLKPIQLKQSGKVFKVRGLAWTAKVSPLFARRMISGAKQILNNFLSDVFITAEVYKGEQGGLSPGFGVVLFAETKEGIRYTAESMSEPCGSDTATLPEDVGEKAAGLLCEQIYRGGCVDSGSQSIIMTLMSLVGGKDVSQVLSGPLTSHTIETLRLIKTYFNITFHFKPERSNDSDFRRTKGGDTLLCTCVGSGVQNVVKLIR